MSQIVCLYWIRFNSKPYNAKYTIPDAKQELFLMQSKK